MMISKVMKGTWGRLKWYGRGNKRTFFSWQSEVVGPLWRKDTPVKFAGHLVRGHVGGNHVGLHNAGGVLRLVAEPFLVLVCPVRYCRLNTVLRLFFYMLAAP